MTVYNVEKSLVNIFLFVLDLFPRSNYDPSPSLNDMLQAKKKKETKIVVHRKNVPQTLPK